VNKHAQYPQGANTTLFDLGYTDLSLWAARSFISKILLSLSKKAKLRGKSTFLFQNP
jgi:hypothetical protein